MRAAKDIAAALEKLEQEMSEKQFAKQAKDKMEWATTLKSVASDFVDKHQWDNAYEKIEEGRKVLDELSQVGERRGRVKPIVLFNFFSSLP